VAGRFSSVPELIAATVAGFSVGPMVLLLAGEFTTVPVILSGLVGALAYGLLCGLPPTDDKHGTAWTSAMFGFVLVWLAANFGYAAQNVFATRDPATYNLAARWLMDNPTMHISTHPELFGSPTGFVAYSPGFSAVSPQLPGHLYAQGNHLMPIFAAIGGWVAGIGGLFRANLVLGALGLIGLYAIGRRIVGPPLALLAVVAMAVSMPMLFVSRDMYSETLMMLFLLGGTAVLHRAVTTGRRWDYLLAGLIAGSAAMVRIDSYLALLVIVVSAIAVVSIAPLGQRRAAIVDAGLLLAGAAAPMTLGWLDVSKLSSGYYHDQHHNISLEFLALAGVLALAPAVVWVAWRPGVRTWVARPGTVRLLCRGLVAGLITVFVLLLSRPLWLTGRYAFNHTLERWQAEAGVPVDGTRSYNEYTLYWLGDYYGWPTVVFGVVGYSLLLVELVKRRALALGGMLTLGLAMSGLYLWNANITPDQPWAMRRYVPVVLPLLLVAAVAGLRALAGRGGWGRPVAILFGVVAVAFPAVISWPMRTAREEVPQYRQVVAMCRAVGSSGAVVEVDESALNGYGQTVRSYCGVPSLGLIGATPAQLQEVRQTLLASNRRLFVISMTVDPIGFAPGVSHAPFSIVNAQHWPNTINKPPAQISYTVRTLYLAEINPEGLAVPVR
jgi:hypothetical protein